MPTDYPAVFKLLLDPLLASNATISRDLLFSDAMLGTVENTTKLGHLKKFISKNVQYVGAVQGVLPDDAALLKAVERKLGAQISEKNVVHANKHCAQIVISTARPVLENFVEEAL